MDIKIKLIDPLYERIFHKRIIGPNHNNYYSYMCMIDPYVRVDQYSYDFKDCVSYDDDKWNPIGLVKSLGLGYGLEVSKTNSFSYNFYPFRVGQKLLKTQRVPLKSTDEPIFFNTDFEQYCEIPYKNDLIIDFGRMYMVDHNKYINCIMELGVKGILTGIPQFQLFYNHDKNLIKKPGVGRHINAVIEKCQKYDIPILICNPFMIKNTLYRSIFDIKFTSLEEKNTYLNVTLPEILQQTGT